MKIIEDIRPVTYLKSKTADALAQINKTHRPMIITQNGEPKAVLQDPETFEQTRAAIGIMKLLMQGEEDVKYDRLTRQDELFARLKTKLSK